jgi:hypothetical protein
MYEQPFIVFLLTLINKLIFENIFVDWFPQIVYSMMFQTYKMGKKMI